MKVKSLTNAISKKENNGTLKVGKIKVEKIDTYSQTLDLLNK
jgi:hypothetical protein